MAGYGSGDRSIGAQERIPPDDLQEASPGNLSSITYCLWKLMTNKSYSDITSEINCGILKLGREDNS
jgi:hypothetical protein